MVGSHFTKSLAEGRQISTEPFFVFTIEEFFEKSYYRELCNTFPSREWFTDVGAGNKLRLNVNHEPEKFVEFVQQSTPWYKHVTYLSSKDFLTNLYALVGPHLPRARGHIFSRAWNFDDFRIGESLFTQNARTHFEFSRLERGSSVPAHTDAPEKIVSIILYFANKDWKEEYGGGTIFYKTTAPRANHNWFNRKVPFDELEPFFECPFKENQLLLFLKSENSYHGVVPLKSPKGLPRNSLNVNVFAKPPTRFKKIGEMHRRLRKRSEQRYWRNAPRVGA